MFIPAPVREAMELLEKFHEDRNSQNPKLGGDNPGGVPAVVPAG